jgi:hypothetical protein
MCPFCTPNFIGLYIRLLVSSEFRTKISGSAPLLYSLKPLIFLNGRAQRKLVNVQAKTGVANRSPPLSTTFSSRVVVTQVNSTRTWS